jgi:hypothetical protein
LISALLEIFNWWGIELDVEASNFFDSDKVWELAAASPQTRPRFTVHGLFKFAGPEKA